MVSYSKHLTTTMGPKSDFLYCNTLTTMGPESGFLYCNTLTTMGPKSGFPYYNLTCGNVTNNQYFLFEPDNPHQECTPYPSPGDVLGSSVDTALGTVTNNHCSGTDAIQHLSFLTSCDIWQKCMVPKYFC